MESPAGAPQALAKAPALGTINGIGLSVYGRRDPADDGSYTITRYFTFLFVPLLPLDAFRVVDAEGGGYYFLAKMPLPAASFWWRRLVWLAFLAVGLGLTGWAYWSSPERRLAAALEEVRAAEAQAASAEARAATVADYERLIQEFAPEVEASELQEASASMVRLLTADVDAAFALDDVDQALGIARRVESLPSSARTGEAAASLARRLEGWADALGTADEASLRGSLRLLNEAERLAPSQGLESRRSGVQRQLAAVLAADWPLEAAGLYLDLGDAQAHAAGGVILQGLGRSPALWLQLEDFVERWAGAAGEEGAPLAAELRQRVAMAHRLEADETRRELLESGDEAGLRQALRRSPGDQDLAVALAEQLRGSGRSEAALELMEELGKPGVLVRDAQLTLTSLWRDTGRPGDARDLLERMLESRLPGYEALGRRFSEMAIGLQSRLIERAQRGDLPPDLQAELEGLSSEDEKMRRFGEWLSQQLEADPELQELRQAYDGYDDVMPTALALGGVTLRLANETEGASRARLLEAAERAFVSIQGDAEGVPSYHLGLGQVYHRLGKTEQGEQEFAGLLASEDDGLALAVADAYRDLGMLVRAREVNVQVAERASGAAREQALITLGIIGDTIDDRERWLRQADQETPFVRYSLLQIEADRLAAQGDCAAADEKYAEVFEWEIQGAEANPVAANNAALTLARRYGCTGDLDHLDRAISLMERGLRLSPDNALLVTNYSEITIQRGSLRALEPWLDLLASKLSAGDAATVIDAMLEGPEREELLATLVESSDLRRGRELARQQQVLGPHRPDGYNQELRWYAMTEDVDMLRDLKARVERVDGIDTSRQAAQAEEWYGGAKDTEYRSDWEGQLEALRARRAALPAGSKASTRAVSRLLESEVELKLAYLDSGLPHARAAVEALEQARREWPGIGGGRSLAVAWMTRAVLEVAATDPDLARAWKEEGRRFGIVVLLDRLKARGGTVEAVLRRPELRNAVELLVSIPAPQPALTDYVVGRLMENAELNAAGRQWLGSELKLLEAELSVMLRGSESSVAVLELLREARAAG